MGTGGGLFDAHDIIGVARLNQKATVVDTGTNIAALATTYAGMTAYCTSTSGGFTVDHLYIRNSANAAWIDLATLTVGATEVAEASQTQSGDTADFTAAAGRRYYSFFTLPSTEEYYLITKIEWKNGATVNGSVLCGVDVVNANPPTTSPTPGIAWGLPVAQSGASALQSISSVSSALIPKSTIIGVWYKSTSGTNTFRNLTGAGAQNQERLDPNDTFSYIDEDVGWTAVTTRKHIVVYYRGYK